MAGSSIVGGRGGRVGLRRLRITGLTVAIFACRRDDDQSQRIGGLRGDLPSTRIVAMSNAIVRGECRRDDLIARPKPEFRRSEPIRQNLAARDAPGIFQQSGPANRSDATCERQTNLRQSVVRVIGSDLDDLLCVHRHAGGRPSRHRDRDFGSQVRNDSDRMNDRIIIGHAGCIRGEHAVSRQRRDIQITASAFQFQSARPSFAGKRRLWQQRRFARRGSDLVLNAFRIELEDRGGDRSVRRNGKLDRGVFGTPDRRRRRDPDGQPRVGRWANGDRIDGDDWPIIDA